jgi:hypothetical protein
VRLLIRAGAHVNVSGGRNGIATLEAAVERRDMSTFRAVLDAGAKINFRGKLTKTAYMRHTGIFRVVLGQVIAIKIDL